MEQRSSVSRERFRQIDDLLDAILEQPTGSRAAYLERATAGDPELRRDVAALLESSTGTSVLDVPAFSIHDADSGIGRQIGPYRTIDLLGRGGMGVVYLAEREGDFETRVAVKLIKRGMDTDEVVRRFRNERQILAELEHANIARLLDGGSTEDGLPYFVMEYVEGQPIDAYCDAHRLALRPRLHLFQKVCGAVHSSHQHLVVHRDLKPGNILVTAEGVPKLLDFGIAKLLAPDLTPGTVTSLDQRPMTLDYASPEQARGEPVSTRSDVYALGVLLYRLLTGQHPYPLEELGPHEKTRVICEREPLRPSLAVRRAEGKPEAHGLPGIDSRRLQRQLTGDLDFILLRALEKEPRYRYGSVEQLAADIRRYLRGKPVLAHEGPTFAYRAKKFVRRNKLAVTAAVVGFSFGVTATVTTIAAWQQTESERKVAVRELAEEKRGRKEEVREREKANRIVRAFRNFLRDPAQPQGDSVTTTDILEHGRRVVANELEGEPELQADVLGDMAQLYRNLGQYDAARELTEESFRILDRHYDGDHSEVAKRLNNLAVVLYDQGDYDDAEKYFRRTLEMRRRLGDRDQETRVRNNLASLLLIRGEYAEAERLYLEGLARRMERDGPDDRDVATSLRSLGTLHYTQGLFEKAEPPLREALAIRRRVYGKGDPKVAAVLDKLGSVLAAQGRGEEAEASFLEALEIQRTALGEDHLDLARTRKNLAALLLAEGSPETAAVLLPRALATFYRVKPAGDWEIADAESVLGAYLMAVGRLEEAEACLRQSHATLLRERGERAIFTRQAERRLRQLDEVGSAAGAPAAEP